MYSRLVLAFHQAGLPELSAVRLLGSMMQSLCAFFSSTHCCALSHVMLAASSEAKSNVRYRLQSIETLGSCFRSLDIQALHKSPFTPTRMRTLYHIDPSTTF